MATPLYGDPDAIPPGGKWEALKNPRAHIQYSLLVGQDPAAISQAFEFPILKCDANGHLITARAPNSQVTFQKFTPSTAAPTRLDIGFLGANRDMLTIYNSSDQDLYIHLGFFVSTTTFTTILRGTPAAPGVTPKGPQFWSVPVTSPFYGGAVWGVWPTPGSGGASCVELT